jgi:hypothetical protein
VCCNDLLELGDGLFDFGFIFVIEDDRQCEFSEVFSFVTDRFQALTQFLDRGLLAANWPTSA